MADKFYNEQDVQNIANSIRNKNGATDKYTISEMSAAIDAIEVGGGVTSVNNKTGDITLTATDIGAVSKVNGKTGEVTLTADDLSAVTAAAFDQTVQNLSTGIDSKVDYVSEDGHVYTTGPYVHSIPYSSELLAASIVMRGIDGSIMVPEYPSEDSRAASKKYVDDAVAVGSITVDSALSDTSENPVQNKTVKAALDGKLTRLMGGTSDFLCTVYAETPVGSQTMLAVASTAKSNAVVQRDSSGRFEVASPTSDNDCATKKYVDDAVAGASSGGGGRVSSFAWRADSFGAQVSSKTISMPSFTASELKNALIFVRGTYQYTDSELSAWQTTMCTAEYPLPGREYTIDSPATPVNIVISNSGDYGHAVVSFTVAEGSITVSVDKDDGLSQYPRISFIGVQVLGI